MFVGIERPSLGSVVPSPIESGCAGAGRLVVEPFGVFSGLFCTLARKTDGLTEPERPRRVSFSLPTAMDDTISSLYRRHMLAGDSGTSTAVCSGPTQPTRRVAFDGASITSARSLCGGDFHGPSSLTSQTFIRRRLCGLRNVRRCRDPCTPSTDAGGAFVTTGRRPVGVWVFGAERGVVGVLFLRHGVAADQG